MRPRVRIVADPAGTPGEVIIESADGTAIRVAAAGEGAVEKSSHAGDWEDVLARFLPIAEITPEEIAFLRSDPAGWGGSLDGAH